jgi:uncharacterized protein (TIGR02271 family)
MTKTIVSIFDELGKAQNAQRELINAGIKPDHVRLTSQEDDRNSGRKQAAEPSWKEKIIGLFDSLFEHEDDRHQADHYAEAWRRGHHVVMADLDDSLVDRAINIVKRHGAIDIDQRAQAWKSSGYDGTFDHKAPVYTPEQRAAELASYNQQSAQTVPVIQEELAVGKQVVQRGGVRVHSYVQERPVEERIRLREEHVNVARRPVNRPVTEADNAFQERTIAVTAQDERAVVEKRARVVEEVTVGKDVKEREETVHETLRRKDVDVEQVAAKTNPNPPTPSRR